MWEENLKKIKSFFNSVKNFSQKNKDKFSYLILFCFFIILSFYIRKIFLDKQNKSLKLENVQSFKIRLDEFNKIKLISKKNHIKFSNLLTTYSLKNNFIFDKKNLNENEVLNHNKNKKKFYSKKFFQSYYKIIDSIIEDIKFFPIADSNKNEKEYYFANSWAENRNYNFEKNHQGIDIIDKQNKNENLIIVSMSNGVIEKIGWDDNQGFRIGVRTENGNYFLYSHMSKFSSKLKEGMIVYAGQFLGFMGRTSLKQEGIKNNFITHLHFGIEPNKKFLGKNFWINPYIFLKNIEHKKMNSENLTIR